MIPDPVQPPEPPVKQIIPVHTNFVDRFSNLVNNGPIVELILNKTPIKALVDSGASVSLINQNLAKNFPHFENNIFKLRSISNDHIEDSGLVLVTFEMANHVFKFPMVSVSSPLNPPIVLGDDFLSNFKLVLDRNANQLFSVDEKWSTPVTPVPNKWEPYNFSNHIKSEAKKSDTSSDTDVNNNNSTPNFKNFIRVSSKVTLPPRSKVYVPISQVIVEANRVAVVTPSQKLMKSNNIIMPYIIVSPETSCVILTNTSCEERTLSKGTKLGRITNTISNQDIRSCPVPTSTSIRVVQDSSSPPPPADLRKNINKLIKIGPDVSFKTQVALRDLVEKYHDVFAWDSKKLTQVKNYQFHIETGNAAPVRSKPFNLSERENEVINDNVQELLSKNLIEPSSSAWSANPFLVPNRDELGQLKYRMVLDYRKLNDVTKPLAYPLPRIDTIINKLRKAKFISCLDMASGYHQLALDEDSKEKTAFQTTSGLWQWKVMPFGPRCAPAAFSQLVHLILAGIIDEHLSAYIDDICLFTETEEQHLMKLEEVLSRLRVHGLLLKPTKCKLMFQEIRVLGYKATKNGILPTDEHISGLTKMKSPTTPKKLRECLGFFGWFRKFIRNYATIVQPLKALIKSDKKFKWTDEHEKIFNQLKQLILNAPILAHCLPDLPLILRTDACMEGLGASLSQIQHGQERFISFISRETNNAEKKYTTSMLETLAVAWALQKLRPYVFQRKVTVYTDHSALCAMAKGPKYHLPSRLARLLLSLEEYDLTLYHVRGSSHQVPDTLSRNAVEPPPAENPNTIDLPILALGYENIASMQKRDPEIVKLFELCHHKKNKGKLKHLLIYNNILMYQTNKHERPVVVLPAHMRQSVLTEMHDDPISAHLGFYKTYMKINSRYYWPTMRRDIKQYVRTCDLCQRRKLPKSKPPGLLQPIPVPETPFTTIGCDLVGPINRSKSGKKYIITVADLATRYLECAAIPNGTAEEIAKFMVERIYLRHGVPHNIITDLGTAFTGELFAELNKFMGITHNKTTSFHPQSNGACERQHATIMDAISYYVSSGKDDWDLFLPHIQFAINSAVHEGHQFTPHYLLYGQEPVLPSEAELGLPRHCSIADIAEKVQYAREIAAQRLRSKQERNARYANQHRRYIKYRVGDLVLLRKLTQVRGKSQKLYFKWIGPFTIISKSPHNEVNYVVETVGRRKLRQTVHVEKLKLYHQRDPSILETLPPDVDSFEARPDDVVATEASSSSNLLTSDMQPILPPIVEPRVQKRIFGPPFPDLPPESQNQRYNLRTRSTIKYPG